MQTPEEALRTLDISPRDPKAWETLTIGLYKPLLAYVASLLLTFRAGSGETAEDIVQEVLLRFYSQWQKGNLDFPTSKAVDGYLRRSSRNILIDRYRSERSAKQLLDFLEFRFNNAFGDETEVYRDMFVNEILDGLPGECGNFLRQYVLEDITVAEIADRENEEPRKFYPKWYRCMERAKEIFLRKAESKRS